MDITLNKSFSDSKSLNKSLSDPSIHITGQTDNLILTPSISPLEPNKRRKRDDGSGTSLSSFREEIISVMKKMLDKQESELKKITPILMEIKQTNSNIENSIAFLSSQNEEFKKRIDKLENLSQKDKEYITLLEEKIEDIQRYCKKTSIEIKNVPRTDNETKEDLLNMALNLSKSIDCTITKSDITDIYRIQDKRKGKHNTPIIVETSSAILKNNVLKSCKSFNYKHKEKLCNKHLGSNKNGDTPIYVSEQLTAKGARLHFLARDLAKTKSYKYCWTSYGRVYIRKDDNSPIIIIKNEHQIHNLTQGS